MLVLFILLAYFPALRGDFIWDDEVNISANPTLHSPGGLWDIWFKPGATFQFYPLTYTGFWIGYHFWGLNPLGYHLLTLCFHIVTTLLLWQVLAHLNVRGAWLGAAIFALHPVNAMSVAWMTELKNTLSAALALGSAWAYLRFARLGVYAETGKESGPIVRATPAAATFAWRWYAVALALFVLAMLAKTAVSFLPLSLLLIIWWERQRLVWREVWPVLPMVGWVAIFGAITLRVEREIGATGEKFSFGLLDRILISGRSFWFYLGKLVFPYPLTVNYERWTVNPHIAWQYLYPMAAVVLFAGLWVWRDRLGRGSIAAFLHFYVCTSSLILVVALSFTLYSFVSDHWQYFGCMSVFALAAAGITSALETINRKKFVWQAGFCGMLLLLLGTLTWRQAGLYRDGLTLWSAALATNEKSWYAHLAAGKHLYDAGRLDEALEHYRRAVQLKPDEAMTHGNYATTLWLSGRLDEAEREFQQAIQLKPDYFLAHANYCALLIKRGKLGEAETEVRQLLRLAPDSPVSLYHYGYWLMLRGDADEAEAQLSRAIEKDPDYLPARMARARLFQKQGRLAEAMREYQAILQQSPASGRARLGVADTFRLSGRLNEAIACYRDLLRADPDNPDARIGLGMALIDQGDYRSAEPEFLSVLQADSKNVEAMSGLGQAIALQGRFDEARARFLDAMQLAPQSAYPHLCYAISLAAQRRTREAMAEYRQALTRGEQLSLACNNLAWILATNPDPQIRNGREAVELAERACRLTHNEIPTCLDTLAAAYAEAGRFPEAVTTAERARELAGQNGPEEIARRNLRLLESFRAGRPYRESAPGN